MAKEFNLFDFGISTGKDYAEMANPFGAAISSATADIPKNTVNKAGAAVPVPYADFPSYRKAQQKEYIRTSDQSETRPKFVSEPELIDIASKLPKELRGQVVQEMINRGYTVEGANDPRTMKQGQEQSDMAYQPTEESVSDYKRAQATESEWNRSLESNVFDKMWENIKSGGERIGTAGQMLANASTGEEIGQSLVKGGAGALEIASAPLTSVIGEATEYLTPASLRVSAGEAIAPVAQKYSEFKSSLPEDQQKRLDALLEGTGILTTVLGAPLAAKGAVKAGETAAVGAKATAQAVGNVGESIAARRLASQAGKMATAEAKAAEKLTGKLVEANIGGKTVKIPKPKTGLVRKTIESVSKDDTKTLAGRAIMPSYAGKTPKQIVNMGNELEGRVKSFYEMARTGRIKDADIGTLQDAARTAVSGIDEIGEKIGNAVKGTNVSFEFPKDVLARMKSQLNDPIDAGLEANGVLKEMVGKLETIMRDGKITAEEGFRLKGATKDRFTDLVNSQKTSSQSYAALRDGMESLVNGIDEAVAKAPGGKEFQALKKDYGTLKSIVKDMAKSATVEGRKAPMSFVEQMSFVQNIPDLATRPLATATGMARQKIAKELAEMNSRGGAWERLISKYDQEAIKAAKTKLVHMAKPAAKPVAKPVAKKVLTPAKTIK